MIEKALPVAVRFLTKGNTEVCRSLSSYLSLAAMSNARLLAAHLPLMLDSIIVYRKSFLLCLPVSYYEYLVGRLFLLSVMIGNLFARCFWLLLLAYFYPLQVPVQGKEKNLLGEGDREVILCKITM